MRKRVPLVIRCIWRRDGACRCWLVVIVTAPCGNIAGKGCWRRCALFCLIIAIGRFCRFHRRTFLRLGPRCFAARCACLLWLGRDIILRHGRTLKPAMPAFGTAHRPTRANSAIRYGITGCAGGAADNHAANFMCETIVARSKHCAFPTGKGCLRFCHE